MPECRNPTLSSAWWAPNALLSGGVMAANYERVYYRVIDERRNAVVTGRLEGRRKQRCETGEG
jgi:hypothetical protein